MSFNPAPINQFTARVRAAGLARARDVRLDLSEAIALVTTLTELLALLRALERVTHEATIQGSLDGGSFKP